MLFALPLDIETRCFPRPKDRVALYQQSVIRPNNLLVDLVPQVLPDALLPITLPTWRDQA